MFTKVSDFFKNNSQKILSSIGVLAVFAIIIGIIYQSLNYISGLRGFNFDPFLLIGIVLFTYYFRGILQNQNQILSKQQILLEKLLSKEVNLNSAVTRSRSKTVVAKKIQKRRS